jgi:hypothetical protein
VAVPRVAGPSSCSRVLGSRQPVRGGRHSADRVSSRLGRPPANATCRGCLATETPNARRRSDPATGAKATVPVHAGVARGLSATGHSAIQEEQQVVEPAYKVRIGACPRVREAAPSHRGSSQLYRSHLVQDLESPGPDLQAGHPRSNRSSAGIRGQTGQERGLAVVGIRRGAEITHLAS